MKERLGQPPSFRTCAPHSVTTGTKVVQRRGIPSEVLQIFEVVDSQLLSYSFRNNLKPAVREKAA
jgi:hypothetical protein